MTGAPGSGKDFDFYCKRSGAMLGAGSERGAAVGFNRLTPAATGLEGVREKPRDPGLP